MFLLLQYKTKQSTTIRSITVASVSSYVSPVGPQCWILCRRGSSSLIIAKLLTVSCNLTIVTLRSTAKHFTTFITNLRSSLYPTPLLGQDKFSNSSVLVRNSLFNSFSSFPPRSLPPSTKESPPQFGTNSGLLTRIS